MNAHRLFWPLGGCLLATLLGCSEAQETPPPAGPVASESPYAAIARGKVEVQGGLLDFKVVQSGRLDRLAVGEGSQVKQGAELGRLDDQAAQLESKAAEAELERAQALQGAAAQRLPSARQAAQRLQQAARLGASDAQHADNAAQQLQQLEAALAVAKTEVEIARQRLAQAKVHLAERTLFAPQAGTVVRVNATLGARVAPEDAQPLLVLLPARPLQVRAELNESMVARVRPGMAAEVVQDAAPEQPPLKAHVLRIGEVFGGSRLGDDNQMHNNVRVVDCLLAFDQAPTLRIGQNVRVNFHD